MTRTASKPAAGAVRGGISGILAALVVSYVLTKTGNEELAVAAGAATTAIIQYLGKLLRDYAADQGGIMHLSP